MSICLNCGAQKIKRFNGLCALCLGDYVERRRHEGANISTISRELKGGISRWSKCSVVVE